MKSLLFFILLSIILISLAVAVIGTTNPVHSVCYLIMIYLVSSMILFIIGQDFLAIVYIIVYIGAIMVLFLFIIMMLNIRLMELRSTSFSYLPAGLLLLVIFSTIIYLLIFKLSIDSNIFYMNFYGMDLSSVYTEWILYSQYKLTNIHFIGLFLYNKYALILILCGFLLFISTIGSILVSFVLLKDSTK